MANIENIEDFLRGKLTEAEHKDFVRQMEADPSLRAEVRMQEQIVKSIRQARVTELKHMLNQVPVSAPFWSAGAKIAAVIVTTGVIGSAWFYLQSDEPAPVKEQTTVVSPATPLEQPVESPRKNDAESGIKQEPGESVSQRKEEKLPSQITKPVVKPNISPIDPTEELITEHADGTGQVVASAPLEVGRASISSTVHSDDPNHAFHYQFQEGKLHLYGPFDKSLYEILEINGVNQAVFLYYENSFYVLDQRQQSVTALQAIKDASLLAKLKKYHNH